MVAESDHRLILQQNRSTQHEVVEVIQESSYPGRWCLEREESPSAWTTHRVEIWGGMEVCTSRIQLWLSVYGLGISRAGADRYVNGRWGVSTYCWGFGPVGKNR